jgi:putative addiction module CopG family antidote
LSGNLTPELEATVLDKLATGLHSPVSEVVHEALQLMEERDRFNKTKLDQLRVDIRAGNADTLDAEKIKQRGRARLGMKCPACAASDLVPDTRNLLHTCKGETITIPDVVGEYCPECNECVLDASESSRVIAAMLRARRTRTLRFDQLRSANREFAWGPDESAEPLYPEVNWSLGT